ncbi:rhodanese-like domain-containing protein [Nocardioides sp.]|uniref:rhodanese-like domain-containing protein n=1 Tax=Nocardioides sp. TaxID=35761 RepID=UPI00321A8F16
MTTESGGLKRGARRRSQDPRSVPWAVAGELDVVAVDTTWGELQPLNCAPDVPTVGELEVLELLQQGAVLIDTRVPGSNNGVTLPGARSLPHDQAVQRRGELDPSRVSILFCNGPQCPQSPQAIRALLEAGLAAESLAYYRGGVHDWVTLAMPTEATS